MTLASSKDWSTQTIATLTSGGPSFAVKQFTGNAVWIFPENQLARILVNRFKAIPQVESICINFGESGYTVWTLLKSYDRDAREEVYKQEMEICDSLRIYDFDFRVTSSELVSRDELISTGSLEIYRRP